ncbi:unnamed protein product, partial [Cuscuta campestris]
MQLEQRFYNTVKGTSTIATYCQTLRNIADWLDDVDAPVTENQLVLQTLRGLPEDLGSQASFLQFQKPPATFMETRSALLLLEGQRRPQTASGDEGTSLATLGHGGHAGFRQQGRGGTLAGGGQQGGSSGGQHFGGQLHGGQPQGNSGREYGYGGRGGRPNRGRGRGCNSGFNSRTATTSFGPWQTPYQNPGPGLLGPRPTSHPFPAQAHFTSPTYPYQPTPPPNPYPQPPIYPNPQNPIQPHPYTYGSSSAQPQPLTPTALAHHFDTMTLREPTWLMDTSATHH